MKAHELFARTAKSVSDTIPFKVPAVETQNASKRGKRAKHTDKGTPKTV